MLDAAKRLTPFRHRCGTAFTLVRDHVLGITRTIIFEAPCGYGTGPQSSDTILFRQGGGADLLRFTRETHDYTDSEKEFGFGRLERGDSLMIGESAGEVVFYAWLMYGQIDVDQNVCIPTAQDVAYSYRVFTVPSARGLRICGAYYDYIKDFLGKKGYRRLICRIAPDNAASIHAHARAGFERCGLLWKLVTPRHAFYYADASALVWLRTVIPAGYFKRRGFLRAYNT